MTRTLGMIGLGRTGLPLALNLLARGHEVVGYRRSSPAELVRAGGRAATQPREVAERAPVILSCLPSVTALQEVMSGENGLLAALGPQHIVIELSSYPLAVKERYRELLHERGARLVDGELSGTPAMTAARHSVIFVAGDRETCEAVLPLCRDATDHALYAGTFGAATKLKLVANLLVAIHTTAAAEAMLLAERAGLDVPLAIEVLGLGAGASTMLRQRAPSMVARRFVDPAPGPVSMLAAYLEPIRALADGAGAPLPLFSVAAALFEDAIAAGRAAEDIGCVIELLDARKGRLP